MMKVIFEWNELITEQEASPEVSSLQSQLIWAMTETEFFLGPRSERIEGC